MSTKYLRWSEVPYAGEAKQPSNSVTPLAGSWPLVYLKRDRNGNFLNPNGRKMKLPITHPNLIDFNRELLIVQNTLKRLTPNQKKIGIYYGTGVPTKQWTPVIDRLIDTYGVGPTDAARILATVQGAVNDTMIIVWNLKYRWDVARPNQYDPKMRTLLCTPRFPTYPSGHATMSGCAQVVLSYFFPKEAKKLREIANDNALSRLYAGVHFPADNDEGLKLGRFIGTVIVNHLKTQRDSDLKPIDHPFENFLNADIFPDDYNQFISFDFSNTCTSLVMDEKETSTDKNKNIHVPKPLIYL
ncbi:vanadium-dependent haloperoxidase [Metabacillus halosaccharovorans]|uniref:vanadium-dependent haloperoxidase n=1 Tax=Metabacillus halosaccharovorans TaxID=930124 RepID=UPI000995B273|nr:vanadium-dependent haloperoxidase [Metabacillus halosaccharovorans]